MEKRKNDLESIIRAHADMVYRLAFGRTGKKEDAEDVFQEVFLRLSRHPEICEDEGHLKNWLIRVTINCCSDIYRAGARKHETTVKEFPDIAVEDRYSEGSVIYDLLWSLPEKYSTTLHLFYYEERTIQEIAQIRGCRKGTVKSLLSRGRNLLESKLKKEGYER